MNRTLLTAFNNTLIMFIDELITSYPQEKEFSLFKNTLVFMKKANPKKILVLFDEYMVKYISAIKKRDESFFLNETYSDLVETEVEDKDNAWKFIYLHLEDTSFRELKLWISNYQDKFI